MMSIVYFYKYNGRQIGARLFLFPVIYVLFFVFLLTGQLTCFDERRNGPNDRRRSVLLVEAFSLVLPTSWSPSRASFSLLVRSDEQIILDDHYSSANNTVHYSDLINIVSDAQYMDAETKKRFLDSLKFNFSNVSKDVGDNARAINVNESSHAVASANAKGEEHYGNENEAKATSDNTETKIKGCRIPTIKGPWKNDGDPFHASGAWQTTPLLMKGAFVDDIHNITSNDGYPFPSWKEIIELACDGKMEHEDQNFHDEVLSEENSGHNQNHEGENDEGDGDGFESQYDIWDGDSDGDDDDDEDWEDSDVDFHVWDDGDQYHEDEDDNDNPPSRLIQHWWPRQDDPDYYHADVNTNWLDTFEINQFGPFNDPDSLEALLRTEDEDNSEIQMTRTLLVNDVDRWFPKLSEWMDRRFNSNESNGGILPARWRRDDAQISISHPKGGIGPHVDNYDVFLIQLDGERTWDVLWEENSYGDEEPGSGATGHFSSTISVRDESDCILPKSSMNGVRILNVTKLQSLQKNRCGKTGTRLTRLHLRPGDCLYLPPRVLHCGTAVEASEDCMTLSVGCRAPSALELLDGLSDLMKKSAAAATPKTTASAGLIFPSDAAVQAFHKRYTNAEIRHDERNNMNDNHAFEEDNSKWKMSSSPLQSSWLSPQVKNDMKNLVLKAVQTALDDDENILDPLVGRFVTKSNRLEEDEFTLGGGDDASLFSFSYPKALGGILHDERQDKADDSATNLRSNATDALIEVFGTPKFKVETGDFVLRRAEGIAFAWSSVYDKERRIRKYRLYAQGRPPFEVLEAPQEGMEEEEDSPNNPFVLAPNSIVGRLMDRIANGPPLNRAFVVDELQIIIDFEEKGAHYTVTRLLYDLVQEGLIYRGHRNSR